MERREGGADSTGNAYVRITLSLHVATISMQVRHFNCKGLRHYKLQSLSVLFVTDEDLHGQNVFLALKLLLLVSSSIAL